MTHRLVLALLALLLLLGCDATPPPDAAGSGPGLGEVTPAAPVAEPDFLPTPFTAEQIRDEWIPGFTLVMRTETPDGATLERWTVLSADAEGVEIEFQPLDDAGEAAGEAGVARSSWVELRDHANFPAASATREEVTRDTPFGQLDGWLYRVPDEAAGTVSELFFARSLPGAPVHMQVLKEDGQTVMELAQIERSRPGSDPM